MLNMNKYFNLKMPEIILPDNPEKIGDAIRIKSTDSYECRKAVFILARFFRREFNFDGVQYASLHDSEDDSECHAYIWTLEKSHDEKNAIIIGAFVFRLREWGGYGFQWMWLHPFARNRGLLKKHWPLMEEKFGKDFFCEPPYSFAMNRFIQKSKNYKLHTRAPLKRQAPLWIDKLKKEMK